MSIYLLGVKAFIPIVNVINPVLGAFTRLINIGAKIPGVVTTLQVLAAVAIPIVVKNTWNLVAAMFALGLQLKRVTEAAAAKAAVDLATSRGVLGPVARTVGGAVAGGGAAGAAKSLFDFMTSNRSFLSYLKSAIASLVSFVGPVLKVAAGVIKGAFTVASAITLAVAGLIAGVGFWLSGEYKKLLKEREKQYTLQYNAWRSQDVLESTLRRRARELTEQGDAAGLREFTAEARKILKSNSAEERALQIDVIRREVEASLEQRFAGDVRKGQGVPYSDDYVRRFYTEFMDVANELVVVGRQNLEEARKAREQADRLKKEEEQKRDLQELKNRRVAPLGAAGAW